MIADDDTGRLLTIEQTAERLGVSISTLYTWRRNWAVRPRGPAWIKEGRIVRYDVAAVAAWIAGQTGDTR